MMPEIRAMFIEVAAFPAAVGPDDFAAAEMAGLLAGCRGASVVCH
jgi:hypothetical protein